MSDRCQLVCTEYCYIRPVPMPCNRKQHMYAVLAFMTTGVLNCWQGERVMTANSEVHPGVDVDPYSGQSNGMLADG